MQDRNVGNVGDFGKLALLRCLMEGHRLAVGWYLTSAESESKHDRKGFDYLNRPDEFRHLAPEIFDALAKIVGGTHAGVGPTGQAVGTGAHRTNALTTERGRSVRPGVMRAAIAYSDAV